MTLLRDRDGINRILLFRALQLGDLLCAVPALRSLRAAAPAAKIVLAGLPWAAAFAERFDRYLDGFVEFPGFPGLGEIPPDLTRLPGFIAACRERHFDLAFQLHGSGTVTNQLVTCLGARRGAGYYLPGEYCPDDETFMPWPNEGHEIRRLLGLMTFLGAPSCGDHLEFPLSATDLAEGELLRAEARLDPGGYVCIHAGSQLPSRRWPLDRYAAIGDALAAEGLRVVLTGTATEATLTGALAAAMRAPSVDLAGRTSLGGLGALLRGAGLLVCNDTGVSHIAAALQVPSVVIACGSDVERWSPLDTALHRVVWQPVECRPCAFAVCPIGHPCALAVTVERIMDAALELVERGRLPKRQGVDDGCRAAS